MFWAFDIKVNLYDTQILKGKLHTKPKLSMFCALSQNYQHFFFENMIIWKQIVLEIQKRH